jgi:predicted aconitase with swiveling domain
MNQRITVNRGYGKAVTGEALVMREGFSPRYDLDRLTGVISRIGHSAEGASLKDKVLIIPTAKGGVAAGWAFLDIKEKGFAPAAFVFGKTNPVMVQGAVLAGLSITEGWSPDALTEINTGDIVRVDPAAKTIEILSRRG